jgi:hypothetical protein
MAPDAAKKVLNQIAAELRTGKAWHSVYQKFADTYEYPWQETQSDGTIAKGTRTKLGNLGDFVLPANGNPLFSSRASWMPKGHLKKLFQAKAGDILILFDKEDMSIHGDLSQKETGKRLVLHKIREVYNGNESKN